MTRRERELVELVRQGLRNRDIAAELGVTEGTVKVYLHAIFDKFHVENRTELALRAAELIIPLDLQLAAQLDHSVGRQLEEFHRAFGALEHPREQLLAP